MIMPSLAALIFAQTVDSGTCGDNLTWTLDSNGTLTISGTGDMWDYSYYSSPWILNRYDITEVYLESDVTSIGNNAFYRCENITSITIPEGVTSIGHGAFADCTGLTSITIPEGVTSIGFGAFQNCYSLTSITIPNSVSSIGDFAFEYCTDLTSITIPEGEISIVPSALFGYCYSLTSITIPNSVTSIGDSAFASCYSLTNITIPNSVTSIGSSAFSGCKSLSDVYYTGSETEWNEIVIEDGNEYLTNATIHYNWVIGSTDTSFNEAIYRVEYLFDRNFIDYWMDEFNSLSPTKYLLSSGEIEEMNELWNGVTVAFDMLNNANTIVDYSFKEEDVYTAILIDALSDTVNQTALLKDFKSEADHVNNLISSIVDILKFNHNLNISKDTNLNDLSEADKKKLTDAFNEVFEKTKIAGSSAKAWSDAFSKFSDFVKYCTCIEDAVNKFYSYYSLITVSDSMATVLKDMYNTTPKSSTALRNSINFCIETISTTDEEFFDIICGNAVWTTAGKYAISETVGVVWETTVGKAIKSRPEIQVILAAYKVSKCLSNAIFNVENITENAYKMCVIEDYYRIIESTVLSSVLKYNADRTEENALNILNSMSLLFCLSFDDCDTAIDYVDSVRDALPAKITEILGTTDYKETIEYFEKWKRQFENGYQDFNTHWIYNLKTDYPDIYWDYAKLIGDERPLVIPLTSTYTVACPVNVYVYDTNGLLVASVENDQVYATGNITVTLTDDVKTIKFHDDVEYKIVCEGYDTGTMNITVNEYSDNNQTRTANFYDIPVNDNQIFNISTQNESTTNSEYTIESNNHTISADFDTSTTTEVEKHTVSVNGGYVTTAAGPLFEISGYSNETLELTANIPSGYKFHRWEIVTGDVFIEEIGNENTNIRIVQEDSIISAVIEEIPPIDSSTIFTDVKSKSWFKSAVDYVVSNELMNGTSATKFEPNTPMSRAMLVTVLWRLEGSPATDIKVPFTDLKQAWYKSAVAWAYENSIVNGTAEDKFSPNGNITREQMAAILYRYSQYKEYDTSAHADISSFPDAGRVHDYALEAFAWANAEGLITGTTDNGTTILAPRASATRAQVATILMRFCEK